MKAVIKINDRLICLESNGGLMIFPLESVAVLFSYRSREKGQIVIVMHNTGYVLMAWQDGEVEFASL